MLIGELAERTGVSRRALRYYEEQGLLVPERTVNGYRTYSDDAPVIVDRIQGLYASGMDSDDIRRFLPCARGRAPRLEMCDELHARLMRRAAELEDQAETIRRQRTAVLGHLGIR
ncbi:MerR family transcriptional regulator [Rhodococcus artemisiae]|uniref:MerR family DNA-binding transcriptional regulator n=1 Tax=Rhodococcus artemisiae TaxID=714159 RepID=A0ABU7LGS4_9NOCA|nr:MerR family transcriptional regulator [Rhodococcus artemisiae]MEE2060751.1 MerR family DNA-binding transcriptional regulator [Rhodococcus artemisiae]